MEKDHGAVALGTTIRLLRTSRGLTLKALKEKIGIKSSGYLSDIEAGKKNITLARLRRIAKCLGTTAEALIAESTSPTASHASRLADVEKSLPKLARSPIQFISATDATTRGIGLKHLLRETVRQQLQTRSEDLQREVEERAAAFAATLPTRGKQREAMLEWLANNGIEVDILEKHSRFLSDVRSVLIGRERKLLLLNERLSEARKLFVLAREIGYLLFSSTLPEDRSYLYPPDREETFEQVLSDYRASSFAAALLLPRADLEPRLNAVLQASAWDESAFSCQILDHYAEVATEETILYRFSQIMLGRGLRSHFLKIMSPGPGVFRLEKQLNLTLLRGGAAINAGEHLCNRWLATRIINELRDRPEPDHGPDRSVEAQISQFPKDDERELADEFFGISVALPYEATLRVAGRADRANAGAGLPRSGCFVSLTVGFSRGRARKEMMVAGDLKVVKRRVRDSCERCSEPNCLERAVEAGQRIQATWLSRDREIRRLLMMD